MTDYATLRAWDLARPANESDADRVAALTAPITIKRAFSWQDAIVIAQTSHNYSWSRILQRARQVATLPPVSMTDFAILAAGTAASISPERLIDPADDAAWGKFKAGLVPLLAVGDLTQEDINNLMALGENVTTQAAVFGFGENHDMMQELLAARASG